MPPDISFVVASWEPHGSATRALVDVLAGQGVERRHIHISDERISRPVSLNRAIARCSSDYIGFCESDVCPSMNAVATLAEVLDRNPMVGLAAAEVMQVYGEPPTTPLPTKGPDSPDETSVADISNQMWTLNFVLYRKSTKVLFDESYFGNQVFDWDFGLELLRHGYSSVMDSRCAVSHQQTDYLAKSLSYHVCVARNRQIFRQKWLNRSDWKGLEAFQETHPGAIPTIEELTHATEEWQFKYVAEFDRYSLQEFYFNARFGDPDRIESFLRRSRPLLEPDAWTSPLVTEAPPSSRTNEAVDAAKR